MSENDSYEASVKFTETYRQAPSDVQTVIAGLANLSPVGSLSVRQIICRCPPDFKFCECGDSVANRRNMVWND